MNLKFNLQHDQNPRLQNRKMQSGREFKMAAVTKNSKTNLQNGEVYLAEILYEVLVGP